MLTLAFNTSSSLISIALFKDEKLIDFYESEESGKQSELLLIKINEILAKNKFSYQNLDLIAASKGPGSFTGTRINTTCAKTMAMALKKPLILVNNLDALAFSQKELIENKQNLLIAIDAGFNEFFTANYTIKNAEIFSHKEAKLSNLDEIEDLQKQQKIIIKNLEEINAILIANYAIAEFKKGNSSQNQTIYLRDPKIGVRKK
jgi:tRNA threonylcarbamoyladenosine biosynthesis protein TsaB